MPRSHIVLYIVYIVIWIIAAIHPKYPEDWLLENVLVITLFPLIVWLDKKFRFTFFALMLLLIFTSLHTLGAHYTYAEMPFFEPVQKFFGFERNHFDRVVHFLFGLLLFRPLFEIFYQLIKKPKITLWFTFTVVVSISTFYELLEWTATILFHPDLGMAFLGTQGDVWDAHKDTLAAILGGLTNLTFFYFPYIHYTKESS